MIYNGYYNPIGGYRQPSFNPTGEITDQFAQYRTQYQQPVQAATIGQPTSPQTVGNGIIWVQGEEGAKAYLVAPGNTVQLWDSENPVIYLKSADMSGMPSMRVLDYAERTTAQKPPAAPTNDFVTRAEFSALEERLNALLEKEPPKGAKSAKSKEDSENG